MKIIFAILASCSLLILIAYPVSGAFFYFVKASEKIEQIRSWFSENGLHHIRVQHENASWGWFQSEYDICIFGNDHKEAIKISNQVFHGPLPVLSRRIAEKTNWRPRLAHVDSTVDFSQLGLPFLMPSIFVAQDIDFVGNVDLQWRFTAFLSEQQFGKLDADSSFGEMQFFATENRLVANGTVPDLRLTYQDIKLQISELKFDFEFTKIQEATLPIGRLDVHVKLGRWGGNDKDYRIKNADVVFQVTDFEQKNNFQLKMHSEGLTFNKDMLANNDWDVILRGISASGIDAILPKNKVASFDDFIQQSFQRLNKSLPQVISGTEFEVLHAELQHETGMLKGFLRTNVPILENVEKTSIEHMLQQINMIAEVSIPKQLIHSAFDKELGQTIFNMSENYRYLKKRTRKSMLEKLAGQAAEQQLQVILASGLVTEVQGNYFSSIELNDGNITFNGHEVHGF